MKAVVSFGKSGLPAFLELGLMKSTEQHGDHAVMPEADLQKLS